LISFYAYEKKEAQQNTAELSIDFTWEGLRRCGWGNPKIHIGDVPPQTRFLKISMYDHA
jgi:hypothetical protein